MGDRIGESGEGQREWQEMRKGWIQGGREGGTGRGNDVCRGREEGEEGREEGRGLVGGRGGQGRVH